MKIRVKEYRRHQSGALQAVCDLEIIDIGLTIKGCRVFQKDKRAWINCPQEKYTKDGETVYKDFLFFDEESKEKFRLGAIDAVRRWVINEQDKASAPPQDADDEPPF